MHHNLAISNFTCYRSMETTNFIAVISAQASPSLMSMIGALQFMNPATTPLRSHTYHPAATRFYSWKNSASTLHLTWPKGGGDHLSMEAWLVFTLEKQDFILALAHLRKKSSPWWTTPKFETSM